MTRPAIGEIVHYVSYGTPGGEYTSQCRAAVVAGLPDDQAGVERAMAGLCVLNPTGIFFNCVPYSDDLTAGGTWHWGHGRTDEPLAAHHPEAPDLDVP